MKKRLKSVLTVFLSFLTAGLCYALLVIYFDIKIPCMFNSLTGLLCPGCGITRMCVFILKGDFYNAFYSNRLVFILIPLFIYFILIFSIRYIKYGSYKIKPFEKIVILFVIILLVLFGIIRNII